jgi:protocatechuate 3,4-dioxygenase beta subunit
MRNLTEANVTEAVLEQIKAENPRLQQVMTSLVKHAHAFIREVEPTEEEWFKAIDFLTRVGHMCNDQRQEFILLSDTLGISILVDAISHRMPAGATESTVFGPFHREGAPPMDMGANIARGPEAEQGEPVVVRGRVTDLLGRPIPSALLDIWQASPEGKYDVQDPNQPEMNLRGQFMTDASGEYWFKTVKPSSYPIPDDGPVGDLLRATGRHPMRPAHIHVMITAKGYETLITHIFPEGDEYLDSDAVFGVKNSLVADFTRNDSAEEAAKLGIRWPFFEVEFNFGLKPAE